MKLINQGLAGGFNASGVPSAYMYKTDATVAQTTTITNTATDYLTVVTTTAGRLQDFTMPSGGKFKYTGTRSFYASISGMISGSSTVGYFTGGHSVALNGSVIRSNEISQVMSQPYNNTGGMTSTPLVSDTLIEFDDEITVMTRGLYAGTVDWSTRAFSLRIDFKGWA